MNTLLSAIVPYDTSFTPSHLYLRTSYPHIPPRPVQDAAPLEGGRRRRGAGGRGQLGGMLAVEALSPAKSRKRVRDEDRDDSHPTPAAKRERESNSTSVHKRGGGASKARKVEAQPPPQTHRANSPSAESVLSITSHPQPPASHTRPPAPAAPAASISQHPPRPVQLAPTPADEGEQGDDGEQDGGRYCYCHGPSYGEMVGCDDDACAYEWFHLTCIGLTGAPKAGTWYCDDCKARRAGNKKGRSGKRRAGGGGGAATAGSATTGGARAGRGRA